MLEEKHRIVIANRGLHQPLCVVSRRRIHHLQSRRVHEIHFRILRMEWTAMHAAARWPAHHHRHWSAPAVMRFRDKIGDLVEAAGDEIDELHFRHGPQAL